MSFFFKGCKNRQASDWGRLLEGVIPSERKEK